MLKERNELAKRWTTIVHVLKKLENGTEKYCPQVNLTPDMNLENTSFAWGLPLSPVFDTLEEAEMYVIHVEKFMESMLKEIRNNELE
jgi:hypothetical protein